MSPVLQRQVNTKFEYRLILENGPKQIRMTEILMTKT